MLTDTSSSSPWLCGSYADNNCSASSSLALYGWDILHTGNEINSNLSSEAGSECSENLSSTLLSEVSSECSDDLHLDLDSVMEESIFGSIINAINNCDTTEEADIMVENVTSKQLVTVTPSHSKTATVTSLHNKTVTESPSYDKTGSKSSLSQDLQSNISKWQILSNDDKLSVIDDLSSVISKELGLREQLEVIRIINPTAQISPTDREFIIDIESINEDKVRRIQEYLVFHASSCSLLEGDQCHFTSPRKGSKGNKKQRSQEQKNHQRIVRQRQRKEYRQMMKERRSGLFAREEVLSVSEVIDPGEEDIDVLG